MKILSMACISLLACSCASQRSFHQEILSGDRCVATYSVYQEKLGEAVDVFVNEYDRLKADGPRTRNARIDLLHYSARNFPETDIWILSRLFRRGCEDPDPEVRGWALVAVEEYMGSAATTFLQGLSDHPDPLIRSDIRRSLEKIRKREVK